MVQSEHLTRWLYVIPTHLVVMNSEVLWTISVTVGMEIFCLTELAVDVKYFTWSLENKTFAERIAFRYVMWLSC